MLLTKIQHHLQMFLYNFEGKSARPIKLKCNIKENINKITLLFIMETYAMGSFYYCKLSIIRLCILNNYFYIL